MGRHNLLPNVCSYCRANYSKVKREVPCEVDGVCGYTGLEIDKGMTPSYKVGLIAQMWQDVIQISVRQRIEKMVKKDVRKIYYLYTITMLDTYLKNQNWGTFPFTQKEAFHLIQLFHIYYNSTIE